MTQVFLYLNRKRHLTPDYTSEEETKSSGDGLRLEWTTSEWSRCSQTCGKDGKQVRLNETSLFEDLFKDSAELLFKIAIAYLCWVLYIDRVW